MYVLINKSIKFIYMIHILIYYLIATLNIFHIHPYIFTKKKNHMQDKHQIFWGMKSNS